MSKTVDNLIAEIDKMLPRYGILDMYEGTSAPSGSAETVFAMFIVSTVRDLCDEESTEAQNAMRLATALELAAYELTKLEKHLERVSREKTSGRSH